MTKGLLDIVEDTHNKYKITGAFQINYRQQQDASFGNLPILRFPGLTAQRGVTTNKYVLLNSYLINYLVTPQLCLLSHLRGPDL